MKTIKEIRINDYGLAIEGNSLVIKHKGNAKAIATFMCDGADLFAGFIGLLYGVNSPEIRGLINTEEVHKLHTMFYELEHGESYQRRIEDGKSRADVRDGI